MVQNAILSPSNVGLFRISSKKGSLGVGIQKNLMGKGFWFI